MINKFYKIYNMFFDKTTTLVLGSPVSLHHVKRISGREKF